MRNLDRIRVMPVEELAEMFISYNSLCRVWLFNGDPDCESYDSKEKAINACIDWLNKEWTFKWRK